MQGMRSGHILKYRISQSYPLIYITILSLVLFIFRTAIPELKSYAISLFKS